MAGRGQMLQLPGGLVCSPLPPGPETPCDDFLGSPLYCMPLLPLTFRILPQNKCQGRVSPRAYKAFLALTFRVLPIKMLVLRQFTSN